MQFLAHRSGDNLQILDDGIRLALILERVLLGPLNVVLEHVVHAPNARRFALAYQTRTSTPNQNRLHISPSLVQIEQLPTVRLATHLDEPLAPVVIRIR